ncbi:eukaryotic translation initiation factor 4E type 3-like [Haliotis rufescens]|uniref:eukaryotic translation initiation factor 4E type 3-like n=1 Tax=Haliotis rufescens TaxID=6454 RepID=UPI001EAFCB99|nr:eukaryotic translation initiation factor 4E type 3-like [Haliotis rufescens]
MAAFNVDSVRESENKVYPGSPQLARKAINEIDTSEQTGVPLNTPWTFWLDKTVRGTSAAQYEASLKKLYTVNTVQGFWSVYNNIPDPSELSSRYSYHLMRFVTRPVWEDEYNSKGGHWRLKCHKHDTPTVWKELLLAAIGEQLAEFMAEDDEIGGVSVSIRDRDDIIQIWNTKAQHAEAATVIAKVRQLLPKVTFTTIFYKAFQSHEAFESEKAFKVKR